MSSRIAFRNTFRLVHGEKFWDQITQLVIPKTFLLFRVFLLTYLNNFLKRFSYVLAYFYYHQRSQFFLIHLFLWRALTAFSNKGVRKRWRQRIKLGIKTRFFIKKKYIRGKNKNSAFILMDRWLIWNDKRFNYYFDDGINNKLSFIYYLLRIKKNYNKKAQSFFWSTYWFKNNSKFIINSKNLFSNLEIANIFENKYKQNWKYAVNSFNYLYLLGINIKFLFWKKRKSWYNKIFFQLFLAKHIGFYFFKSFKDKQHYTLRCQLWDIAEFWRQQFNLVKLKKLRHRRITRGEGYKGFFYTLLRGSWRVSERKTRLVWYSFLMFFYFGTLSRNYGSLLDYLEWIFDSWRRKKQNVFFNFLSATFIENFYSYFLPPIPRLSCYITFKGRLNGIQRARSLVINITANAKPPYQNLMANVIHQRKQFDTKFGSYGMNLWIYEHHGHKTFKPVLKTNKINSSRWDEYLGL